MECPLCVKSGHSVNACSAPIADVSDFRKAGLNCQFFNVSALNPDVAICRFVQLYKCLNSFILRQPTPPTDTLRKRSGAIDMFLSDKRGLDVPCDISHLRLLALPTRNLSSLFQGKAEIVSVSRGTTFPRVALLPWAPIKSISTKPERSSSTGPIHRHCDWRDYWQPDRGNKPYIHGERLEGRPVR